MRRRRSTDASVLVEIGNRLIQADPAAASSLDSTQHLVDGGPLGQSFQLSHEVLLQRLSLVLGAPLQLTMDFLGDISN